MDFKKEALRSTLESSKKKGALRLDTADIVFFALIASMVLALMAFSYSNEFKGDKNVSSRHKNKQD